MRITTYSKPACTVMSCNRKLHSMLHSARFDGTADQINKTEESNPVGNQSGISAASIISSRDSVFLNIVPVKISVGSKTVVTRAFLD